MKQLLIVVIAGFLAAGLFSFRNYSFLLTKEDNTNDTTIDGNWYLKPVLASDTATGKSPQIKFDLSAQKFSGNTGCNSMSGSFFIHADSLSFNEQIIATRMVCQGYNEKAFIDNLTKTNRYRIKEGVLQLLNDQTILSEWTRTDEKNMKKI